MTLTSRSQGQVSSRDNNIENTITLFITELGGFVKSGGGEKRRKDLEVNEDREEVTKGLIWGCGKINDIDRIL